jgi:hypothetical protein
MRVLNVIVIIQKVKVNAVCETCVNKTWYHSLTVYFRDGFKKQRS